MRLHSRHIFLISRPFESWPLYLCFCREGSRVGAWRRGKVVGDKRSQRFARPDIPDDNMLAFFIQGKRTFSFLHHNWLMGPCRYVVLAWGEFDKADKRMRKLPDSLEG